MYWLTLSESPHLIEVEKAKHTHTHIYHIHVKVHKYTSPAPSDDTIWSEFDLFPFKSTMNDDILLGQMNSHSHAQAQKKNDYIVWIKSYFQLIYCVFIEWIEFVKKRTKYFFFTKSSVIYCAIITPLNVNNNHEVSAQNHCCSPSNQDTLTHTHTYSHSLIHLLWLAALIRCGMAKPTLTTYASHTCLCTNRVYVKY